MDALPPVGSAAGERANHVHTELALGSVLNRGVELRGLLERVEGTAVVAELEGYFRVVDGESDFNPALPRVGRRRGGLPVTPRSLRGRGGRAGEAPMNTPVLQLHRGSVS